MGGRIVGLDWIGRLLGMGEIGSMFFIFVYRWGENEMGAEERRGELFMWRSGAGLYNKLHYEGINSKKRHGTRIE